LDVQSETGLDDAQGQIETGGLTPERYSGILNAGFRRIVLQNWANLTDSEAPLPIRLFARLAIMPIDQSAARTLRILNNRPLLVRLVDVRSEI
jgi:hypothetical protein